MFYYLKFNDFTLNQFHVLIQKNVKSLTKYKSNKCDAI